MRSGVRTPSGPLDSKTLKAGHKNPAFFCAYFWGDCDQFTASDLRFPCHSGSEECATQFEGLVQLGMGLSEPRMSPEQASQQQTHPVFLARPPRLLVRLTTPATAELHSNAAGVISLRFRPQTTPWATKRRADVVTASG